MSAVAPTARFRYQASISEIIYDGKRGVGKQKVLNLPTCEYVHRRTCSYWMTLA